MTTNDNTIIDAHLPCPDCGSHDALSLYSDGHTYCFSCQKATQADQEERRQNASTLLPATTIQALPARGIQQSTCQRYGYAIGIYKGRKCHIANYYDEYGQIKGQKLRFQDKTFLALGNTSGTFYGQQLYSKGKRLIITEGEIDCLTVSQVYAGLVPVVSIPSGANSAKRTFEKNLDWLNNFDEVLVIMDNDEAGRKAINEIEGLLPSDKLKIVRLTEYKDPNEYLQHDANLSLMHAIDNAKPYTPDNIINGEDLWSDLENEPEEATGYNLPFNVNANDMIRGLRKGEIVLLTAGTGAGKSTLAREIMYDLAMRHNLKVGVMMLEENVRRTAKGIIGIHLKRPIHITREGLSNEEYKKAFDETLGTGRFILYNHFGSLENNKLINAMRYMAVSEKCDFLILDHVSIATSGIEAKDERKMIDVLMTRLRSLVEETGVGLLAICHLKRTEDKKPHEEGATISINHLRGSQALGQLSDTIIALERNQQAEDSYKKNILNIRVLKCRQTGETGLAGSLHYNKTTNRLEDVTYVEDAFTEAENNF